MSEGETAGGGRWLLVTVSTAGAPASLRVQVWRKLRSLGALYLHQSVCLLPATETAVAEEVDRLLDRVVLDGGTGRLLRLSLDDAAQERSIVAEFRAARDAEYAEVLERVPAFLAELEMERARGRASYVEVEESEADLNRFQGWLAKIEQRDYFAAPGRTAARASVAGCAAALAAFEAEALAAEAPDAQQDDVDPGPAGAATDRPGPAGQDRPGRAGRLRAVE